MRQHIPEVAYRDAAQDPLTYALVAPVAVGAFFGWRRGHPIPNIWQRGVIAVLACTFLAALMHSRFESANLIMVYLLGVMWVAVSLGRGPAVLAVMLGLGLSAGRIGRLPLCSPPSPLGIGGSTLGGSPALLYR